MRCHTGISNHDCRTLRRPIEHTCSVCIQATRQNGEIESANIAVHQSIRDQQLTTNRSDDDDDDLPNLMSGSSSGDDTVPEVDTDEHTRPTMATVTPAHEMVQVAVAASPVQMTAIEGTQEGCNRGCPRGRFQHAQVHARRMHQHDGARFPLTCGSD